MFSPFATPDTYPVYPTTRPQRHCRPAAAAYSRYPQPYLTAGYAMDDDDDDDVDEYEAYDSYRRQLEQAALLQRQRERRQQEEALLRRQLAIEREAERQRQLAAYRAALEAEEEERQRLRAEQAWRARQQEAVRQQRMRQLALEEEELRRRKLVEQQQQKKRITQKKKKQQEEEVPSDPEEVDLNEAFDPLWQLLFGQTPRRAASRKPASKKPESTSASIPVSDPAPSVESAPASAPAPISKEETPALGQDIEAAAEAAQEEEDVEASSAESENAATVLQRHYRTHLHRRQALSTLSALSTSLDSQQASFTLPEQLTFQPSPPASLNSAEQDDENALPKPVTPKLAFSKTNAPFLAYEDFLVGLLSKIDAVSTGGDKTVKKARKELVKRVNDELEKLDAAREKAWAEQQNKEVTEDETFQEKESTETNEAEVTTSAPQAQVDPTSEETSTQEAFTTVAETATEATQQPESEQQAEEQDSSDAETDSTLTEDDREVDVDAVLSEAKKLGEKVERLEQAESDFGVVAL